MVKNYLLKLLSLFFLFGFLFVPLTFDGLRWQYLLTRFVFLRPVAFLEAYLFPAAIKNIDFSSDTIGFDILLGLLFICAVIIALVPLIGRFKFNIHYIFEELSAYYLAFILLHYGFDKIFKLQFYQPEPNILYSTFGSLNKDILFWSTIGLSHTYSLITGLIEVITALFILIWRTRIFGLCLGIIVFINILLINISFDISVKTLTAFLLMTAVVNVYPFLNTLFSFFILNQKVQLPAANQSESNIYKWGTLVLSICLAGYVLVPYLLAGNFNDDRAERPLLHGAYQVTNFIIGKDTMNKDDFPYKRVFIHRNNYIILQRQNDDKMVDYFFEIDPVKKHLRLEDYYNNEIIVIYDDNEKTGNLKLTFGNKEKWVIEAKALNWKELPALNDDMHYTIDEIK